MNGSGTVRLLGIGFEMAIQSLRNWGVNEPPREPIARAIIDLAKAGERDPEPLCELALEACSLMVTAPNLLPPPDGPRKPLDSLNLSQSGDRPDR